MPFRHNPKCLNGRLRAYGQSHKMLARSGADYMPDVWARAVKQDPGVLCIPCKKWQLRAVVKGSSYKVNRQWGGAPRMSGSRGLAPLPCFPWLRSNRLVSRTSSSPSHHHRRNRQRNSNVETFGSWQGGSTVRQRLICVAGFESLSPAVFPIKSIFRKIAPKGRSDLSDCPRLQTFIASMRAG
jgi:hypothetical protein